MICVRVNAGCDGRVGVRLLDENARMQRELDDFVALLGDERKKRS